MSLNQAEILQIGQDYYDVMEKILHHFAGDYFEEEVRGAKADFFENAGILDESSDHYELRMSQFFDWYLFTRELKGFGYTPLEAAFLTRELRFNEAESELIHKLKKHRHSLFQFIKIKDGDLHLKDLLKKEKLVLNQNPYTHGFNYDEIFESRLIPYKETYIFTKGFCFHPEGAIKYITSELKKHQKDPDLNPEDMMLKLIKMRYKFERYRHVKIDMIYCNESKVGL